MFRRLLPCLLPLALACGPERLPAPRNVVLVVVDTLRADHLGAYGYERNTSPILDALAADSVLFESARSQAPCTFPSVNSLLTSRNPIHFWGQLLGDHGIPDNVVSLPEILSARGFSTGAVSESSVVRATPSSHNQTGRFGRGFDHFDEGCFNPDFAYDAACVNEHAVQMLERLEPPFFLYLHYMQPHEIYSPPAAHERRFAAPYQGARRVVEQGNPKPLSALIRSGNTEAISAADLAYLVDLYDDEIAYFDRRFGEFLDELADRGLREDTLIVVTSDHGEDFLDHGELQHCRSLFDSQVKTPLVMAVPGAEPRRVRADVMNLDLAPTILDLLEIDFADFGLEGRSLRRWMEEPGVHPSEGAFSSWRAQRSYVLAGEKLIIDYKKKTAALYALDQDPAETLDVSGERQETIGRMTEFLRERTRVIEDGRTDRAELLDNIEENLRALGYLE